MSTLPQTRRGLRICRDSNIFGGGVDGAGTGLAMFSTAWKMRLSYADFVSPISKPDIGDTKSASLGLHPHIQTQTPCTHPTSKPWLRCSKS